MRAARRIDTVSLHEIPFLGGMRRELHAVMRDARASHPLFEKPLHGASAFEVHGGRHDRFDFTLQIFRERARYAYFVARVCRRAVNRESGFFEPGWRSISRSM